MLAKTDAALSEESLAIAADSADRQLDALRQRSVLERDVGIVAVTLARRTQVRADLGRADANSIRACSWVSRWPPKPPHGVQLLALVLDGIDRRRGSDVLQRVSLTIGDGR